MSSATLTIEFPTTQVAFLALEDDSAFELDPQGFFFGSMPECHIQRCLPGINKVHFIIKKEDENWILLDMSEGKTKVNGERVNSVTDISNGDVITTVWSEFVFMDVRQ